MADNAQIPPTPPPVPKPPAPVNGRAPRQRKYAAGKQKRDCDGNLKLCVRFIVHKLDGPYTQFSDKRFNNNFDAALNQLLCMVTGTPKANKFKGKVAWAEIYDVGDGRRGPVLATWKNGDWHYHGRG